MVDGGQTIIMRAGRVRPELEGQGIFKTLSGHIKTTATARTLAFVLDDNSTVIYTHSFRRVHRKILERVGAILSDMQCNIST